MNRSSGPSLVFICNACRNATRRSPAAQLRQFSSTRERESRALPAFKPTSSTELDSLLQTIRLKYFFPKYLNSQQRKAIQSTKMKAQLENDPVYATLGDEEIRLEHIDVTKDVPRRTAFLDAIDLSKEKKDWANLPGLLEGYHRSKARLYPEWQEKMIKAGNKQGAIGIIIQCLAQVEKNGFSLGEPVVRETILSEIRNNARKAAWSKSEVAKSFKQVSIVLALMEHPEHCGSRTVSEQDPRAEPYVIAIPLELAARRAVVEYSGEDRDGRVEVYTTRLLAALAQQKTHLSDNNAWKTPKNLSTPGETKQAVVMLERLVAKFVPVRNALKLAKEVRGSSWAEEEQAFAVHLQKQIEQRLDLAEAQISKLAASAKVEVVTPAVDEWRSEKRL